jgi:hypothetical protein
MNKAIQITKLKLKRGPNSAGMCDLAALSDNAASVFEITLVIVC